MKCTLSPEISVVNCGKEFNTFSSDLQSNLSGIGVKTTLTIIQGVFKLSLLINDYALKS